MRVLLAAAIAAALLVGLGARSVVARTWCADHPVTATVVVSGEIAPAITQLGRYFDRQHRSVAGHCARVVVRSAAPGVVAAQLSGTARGQGAAPVDAWIPDSGLWPGLARSTGTGARRVRVDIGSVAQTPLVIVMPRSAAASMPAFGTSVSWRFLFPPTAGGPSARLGLHIQFPDPTQSGTGLETLIELERLFGTGQSAGTRLAKFVFHVQVVPTPAGQASLATLASRVEPAGAPSEPVTVIGEQAVIQFDRGHPRQPLAVRYPVEGTAELTFPYVLTSTSTLRLAAAEQFGKLLRTAYATSYLSYQGFRAGSQSVEHWPAWYGLRSAKPRLLPSVQEVQAEQAIQAWHQLSLGSRDLALIDISSSMAVPVAPGGPTLEQVLGRAAGVGLARFPDSTQMGLWAFASNLSGSVPYRELVPVGPLPEPFGLVTRRQEIQQEAKRGRALPQAPADLYGAILAAYRHMSATYQAQYENAVLVLTAGVDHAPDGITAGTLIRQLRALYDPQRPVSIVAIMLGRAGNFSALKRIAAVTGGQAAVITSPSQIRTVFYQAMAQRICRPHCAG